MKKYARAAVVAALALAFVAGSFAVMTGTPAEAAGCKKGKCYKEYRECLVFCSKNPCLVSCEFVLELCLADCPNP